MLVWIILEIQSNIKPHNGTKLQSPHRAGFFVSVLLGVFKWRDI